MKYIPFHKTFIPKKDALRRIQETIESGWLTTGPQVKEFEKRVTTYLGARYGVAVSSGTAALHLGYLATIQKGDEAIVPSFTFCSAINMLYHIGSRIVFCDIDLRTLCIDPQDVAKRITSRTKAIVAVHFAGFPADLDALRAVIGKRDIAIIEDAAHAFGTKYKGAYIGSGKNITCFSFYATKNLTTAEGGMVLCSARSRDTQIRMTALHGISKHASERYTKQGSWYYEVLFPGFKYNLSDIHASIGLSQLPYYEQMLLRRKKIVELYTVQLRNIPFLELPMDTEDAGSRHAWHLYVIRLQPGSRLSRAKFIQQLEKAGIKTSVHFIPNHLQPFYRKQYPNVSLPKTESVAPTVVSLPLFDGLSRKEVLYITRTIRNLLT